ncbi:P22 phage major capsid protein family protein [Microbacterium sp. CFBP9023]|uniref:P22 phage major capsid protein family protein n=1 Tax=Microbacterium sp. CFBP9023 TaxID=3096535 RepID=UPI002A6ABC3A|nr:P22 phage major capsid protein family protein [Microbacterium sp. CFBP9023]MDY0982687.1 P22 phage major capsid protein family protein [Microbacterium sp. CFBP9023]
MAYNTYTPEQAGEVALAAISTSLDLARHVRRYTEADFAPGTGGKAYLRIPSALTARARSLRDTSTAVVFDELIERRTSVDLSTNLVSAVKIGDAELRLDITDFTKQVLRPQGESIADGIDNALAALLSGITASTDPTGYDAAKPTDLFVKGRRALRAKGVDVANSDLVAFVGGAVIDDLLLSGALDFAKTGDANALRSGSAGRIAGFEVAETSRGIEDDEIVFTTRTGLYVATVAPEVPNGVAFGTVTAKDGLSVRYLRDYDATHLTERSVASVFVGTGISPLYDVERDYDTHAATVTPVDGGAVVKVSTSA